MFSSGRKEGPFVYLMKFSGRGLRFVPERMASFGVGRGVVLPEITTRGVWLEKPEIALSEVMERAGPDYLLAFLERTTGNLVIDHGPWQRAIVLGEDQEGHWRSPAGLRLASEGSSTVFWLVRGRDQGEASRFGGLVAMLESFRSLRGE